MIVLYLEECNGEGFMYLAVAAHIWSKGKKAFVELEEDGQEGEVHNCIMLLLPGVVVVGNNNKNQLHQHVQQAGSDTTRKGNGVCLRRRRRRFGRSVLILYLHRRRVEVPSGLC